MQSMASEMVNKQDLKQKMVDKWSIKPSLAEKMVDILIFQSAQRNRTLLCIIFIKTSVIF